MQEIARKCEQACRTICWLFHRKNIYRGQQISHSNIPASRHVALFVPVSPFPCRHLKDCKKGPFGLAFPDRDYDISPSLLPLNAADQFTTECTSHKNGTPPFLNPRWHGEGGGQIAPPPPWIITEKDGGGAFFATDRRRVVT